MDDDFWGLRTMEEEGRGEDEAKVRKKRGRDERWRHTRRWREDERESER